MSSWAEHRTYSPSPAPLPKEVRLTIRRPVVLAFAFLCVFLVHNVPVQAYGAGDLGRRGADPVGPLFGPVREIRATIEEAGIAGAIHRHRTIHHYNARGGVERLQFCWLDEGVYELTSESFYEDFGDGKPILVSTRLATTEFAEQGNVEIDRESHQVTTSGLRWSTSNGIYAFDDGFTRLRQVRRVENGVPVVYRYEYLGDGRLSVIWKSFQLENEVIRVQHKTLFYDGERRVFDTNYFITKEIGGHGSIEVYDGDAMVFLTERGMPAGDIFPNTAEEAEDYLVVSEYEFDEWGRETWQRDYDRDGVLQRYFRSEYSDFDEYGNWLTLRIFRCRVSSSDGNGASETPFGTTTREIEYYH